MKKNSWALTLILLLLLVILVGAQIVSLISANFYPFKNPYCDISIESPRHLTTYDLANILLDFTAKTKDNIPPAYYYFYSLDGQDVQSSVMIENVQIINEEYITGDTLENYTETTLRGQMELPYLSNGPHSIRVFSGGILSNGTIYPAYMDIESFSKTVWFLVGTADASTVSSSISEPTISLPQNKTYNSKFLTLNATSCWFFASIKSMSYSIDEKRSVLLSLEKPESESFNHMNGTVIGAIVLPELAEGTHCISVQVKGTDYFPEISDIIEQATTYFTIDVAPPVISGLSVENKTYNQLTLPLDFAVNEPTSWMSYSLDSEANVTLSGNTTLTLNEGVHSIVVYANDTAGNMGASETLFFTVEPFPTTLVIASVITVVIVGSGLIVNFKKRKN